MKNCYCLSVTSHRILTSVVVSSRSRSHYHCLCLCSFHMLQSQCVPRLSVVSSLVLGAVQPSAMFPCAAAQLFASRRRRPPLQSLAICSFVRVIFVRPFHALRVAVPIVPTRPQSFTRLIPFSNNISDIAMRVVCSCHLMSPESPFARTVSV